jgi:hypothetical protein
MHKKEYVSGLKLGCNANAIFKRFKILETRNTPDSGL